MGSGDRSICEAGDRYEREQLSTLAQLREFIEGTVTIDFTAAVAERYAFIARTVKRFGYATNAIKFTATGTACSLKSDCNKQRSGRSDIRSQ